MLKLVIFAAALAAVTSVPVFPSYMPSPYYASPYSIPFGYTGPVPSAYLRTGIPTPFVGGDHPGPVPTAYLRTGIPTPFVGGDPYSDVLAAQDQEPLLPFTSVPSKPLYLTPEQHHLYQDALKSHDPLGYAEKAQAEKKETQRRH